MTSLPAQLPFINVSGVRVHMVEMGQALEQMEHWIQERARCRYVVVTQMHGIMEARRDENFKAILNSADLFVPDGVSLSWVGRIRGFGTQRRVCGPDLMWEFLKLSEERGYHNYFYGDTEETLERLTSKLQKDFPRLKIAGAHSPPFRPQTSAEDSHDIQMINDSGADVVWIGLGLPKQERWMFEHKDRLNAPVVAGVGAAFKFVSGSVDRAPVWMGNRGLEWLWRFVHEPSRVWRRVLVDARSH